MRSLSLSFGPTSCSSSIVQTPMVWIGISHGTIPHLTPETAELAGMEQRPKMVPFGSVVSHAEEVVSKTGKGIGEFMGLPKGPTLMTVQDPMEAIRPGYNGEKNVSVWAGDRFKVDPERYMRGIKACRPEAFVALTDGETERGSSNKRISKAVKNSIRFLEDCVQIKDREESMRDTLMFGAVQVR